MNDKITASFYSRTEAEDATRRLIERGVPETSIELSAREADGDSPAVGPSLGGGVTTEATNSLIEVHDGEVAATTSQEIYVLSVDTNGDPNRLQVSREILGYMA